MGSNSMSHSRYSLCLASIVGRHYGHKSVSLSRAINHMMHGGRFWPTMSSVKYSNLYSKEYLILARQRGGSHSLIRDQLQEKYKTVEAGRDANTWKTFINNQFGRY